MNLFVIFSYIVTFACGWLNVELMLGFAPYLVTHQTGNVTRIAVAIINGDFLLLFALIGLLAAFIFGSALAGLINPKGDMNFTQRFGIFYIICSVALFMFAWLTGFNFIFIIYSAFFSGYINGFLTQFKIRVSHMSGIASDAGIELGRLCKVALRKNDRNKRTSLNALFASFGFKMISILSFVAGAVVGAALTKVMPMLAVIAILSAFNIALSFFYFKASVYMRDMFSRNG